MSKNLIALISEISKVAGYRIHIQKSVYLYVLPTFSQKLKFKINFIYNSTRNMKYLGMNDV